MEDTAPQPPRRWDPIVKLTHWGVVAAVIGNAIVTEEGSGWHIWVGYGLAALLALRLLWGLIGPAEARFSAFPPSPGRALEHIGEIKRGEVTPHRSHNPLGALMVYAIWATLLVITGTGIAMSGPPPADPSAVRGEHGEKGEKGERGEAGESAAEEARERGESVPALARPSAGREETEEAEEREDEAREDEARERAPAAAANPAVIPALAAQGEEREEAGEARPVVSAAAEADAMLAVADRAEAGEAAEAREGGEGGEGKEEEGELGEVHELAVNLLYVLIALHLAGVVFETRRSGPQIVRAMVPGGTPRD